MSHENVELVMALQRAPDDDFVQLIRDDEMWAQRGLRGEADYRPPAASCRLRQTADRSHAVVANESTVVPSIGRTRMSIWPTEAAAWTTSPLATA